MAGSYQSKKSSKQNDRVDPKLAQSSSRVSNVVGSVGSQSARNNQQANKQGSRSQEQSSPKRSQGKKQRAKKSPSPNANRPAKVSSPSPNGTADSRAIAKVRDAFGNMPPHHQQRLLGIILLLLAPLSLCCSDRFPLCPGLFRVPWCLYCSIWLVGLSVLYWTYRLCRRALNRGHTE